MTDGTPEHRTWRCALTRPWVGYLLLATVFATVCGLLSWWQFARRTEALAGIARLDANYDAAPVPLAAVVPDPATFNPDEEWRVVTVTGHYAGPDMLIRNRPYSGSYGFEIVTPFQTAGGPILEVDRGWVGTGGPSLPTGVTPAPQGPTQITVRLRPGEPQIGTTQSGDTTLGSVNLAELAQRVGTASYTGAYGLLVHTTPDGPKDPLALPRPDRDEGPHLSYGIQWIVFGLGAFGALAWAIRRERLLHAEAAAATPNGPASPRPGGAPLEPADSQASSTAPPLPRPAPTPAPQHRPAPVARALTARARRRPTDADIEDALVDGNPGPNTAPVRATLVSQASATSSR